MKVGFYFTPGELQWVINRPSSQVGWALVS